MLHIYFLLNVKYNHSPKISSELLASYHFLYLKMFSAFLITKKLICCHFCYLKKLQNVMSWSELCFAYYNFFSNIIKCSFWFRFDFRKKMLNFEIYTKRLVPQTTSQLMKLLLWLIFPQSQLFEGYLLWIVLICHFWLRSCTADLENLST